MSTQFKARISKLQVTIAVLHIFLIAIGGCIFGLAVAVRPMLRITKPEFDYMVRTFCNVMVATGISQIMSGGLDIFAACWRLKWPAYLAIFLSSLVIILDMVAMATAFYLLTQAESIVNENILHPWYMMPQAALSALAVFVQCIGILYLAKLVSCLVKHRRLLKEHQIKSREDLLERRGEQAGAAKAAKGILSTPKKERNSTYKRMVQFEINPSLDLNLEETTPSPGTRNETHSSKSNPEENDSSDDSCSQLDAIKSDRGYIASPLRS